MVELRDIINRYGEAQEKYLVALQWMFLLFGIVSFYVLIKTYPAVFEGHPGAVAASLIWFFIYVLCVNVYIRSAVMNNRLKKRFAKEIGLSDKERHKLIELLT